MITIHKITYYDDTLYRYVTEYRNNFGLLHRETGPAVECSDGDYEWYLNGKLHNLHGYARCIKNSQNTTLEYYVYGKKYYSIETFYEQQFKKDKIKYKQYLRNKKFKRILELKSVITITKNDNIIEKDSVILSVIDNKDILQIEKRHNDYIEIYDIEKDEIYSTLCSNLIIENHLIIIKDIKYRILHIESKNEE